MKKVKFQNAGRAMYAMLCAGLIVVGIASVAGYRAAVGSVTKGFETDNAADDIDYSEVDAVLSGIEKANSETPASAYTPPVHEPEYGLPAASDAETDDTQQADGAAEPTDDALIDLTDELEALYYEQAVMMPVNGEILAAYSEGELVKTGGGVWRTHDGIDIAAAEGTDVKSMTSGTVTDVYNDPLWGCCVTVDHGNTLSGCYFGLSPELAVSVGDTLNAGDVIGKVGNTADIESDSGPHLHFALKYENRWIDPISYIEPMK